ncbi:hypothetical protein [Actinoplanes sp. HUAS TT8]|uniref:hypothetical protein n=1 Tax=Actinoplanes sp. HUAS TT8 TaxID=3447453 RepID=UPI003F521FDA
MAETAWLNFHCETDGLARVATFRRVRKEWRLAEVAADPLPEGGTVPGRIEMAGKFGTAPDYAGCPGCGANGYVRCGNCGEIGCWRTSATHHRCPNCGYQSVVSGAIESVDAMEIA